MHHLWGRRCSHAGGADRGRPPGGLRRGGRPDLAGRARARRRAAGRRGARARVRGDPEARRVKYVDEYRDAELGRALSTEIAAIAERGRHYKRTGGCGGHTHAIYKYGIDDLLPANVELVHGPGCPVCVIPMGRVDDAIAIAETPDVIFTSFGDMMRVPASNGNRLGAKARGADVRFVYSPLDALQIATENPGRNVVFFAVGFETTAPSTAITLLKARADGVANFHVFSNHVTIVPPIKAILESPDLRLDGFLGPGHVSTVVGNHPYRLVPGPDGPPPAP